MPTSRNYWPSDHRPPRAAGQKWLAAEFGALVAEHRVCVAETASAPQAPPPPPPQRPPPPPQPAPAHVSEVPLLPVRSISTPGVAGVQPARVFGASRFGTVQSPRRADPASDAVAHASVLCQMPSARSSPPTARCSSDGRGGSVSSRQSPTQLQMLSTTGAVPGQPQLRPFSSPARSRISPPHSSPPPSCYSNCSPPRGSPPRMGPRPAGCLVPLADLHSRDPTTCTYSPRSVAGSTVRQDAVRIAAVVGSRRHSAHASVHSLEDELRDREMDMLRAELDSATTQLDEQRAVNARLTEELASALAEASARRAEAQQERGDAEEARRAAAESAAAATREFRARLSAEFDARLTSALQGLAAEEAEARAHALCGLRAAAAEEAATRAESERDAARSAEAAALERVAVLTAGLTGLRSAGKAAAAAAASLRRCMSESALDASTCSGGSGTDEEMEDVDSLTATVSSCQEAELWVLAARDDALALRSDIESLRQQLKAARDSIQRSESALSERTASLRLRTDEMAAVEDLLHAAAALNLPEACCTLRFPSAPTPLHDALHRITAALSDAGVVVGETAVRPLPSSDIVCGRPPARVAAAVVGIADAEELCRQRPRAMTWALQTFRAAVVRTLAACGGHEQVAPGGQTVGIFKSASDAVRFCLRLQLAVMTLRWPDELLTLESCRPVVRRGQLVRAGPPVRAGVHAGLVDVCVDGSGTRVEFTGTVLDDAARLEELAPAGSVCVTQVVMSACSPDDLRVVGRPEAVCYGRKTLPTASLQVTGLVPGGVRIRASELQCREDVREAQRPDAEFVALLRADPLCSDADWDEQHETLQAAAAVYAAVVRSAVQRHDGREIKSSGDVIEAAFDSAVGAGLAALRIQSRLVAIEWPSSLLELPQYSERLDGGVRVWRGLRVRVLLHCGTAERVLNEVSGEVDYKGGLRETLSALDELPAWGGIVTTGTFTAALGDDPLRVLGNPVRVDLGARAGLPDLAVLLPRDLSGRAPEIASGVAATQPAVRPSARRRTVVSCAVDGCVELCESVPVEAAEMSLRLYRALVRRAAHRCGGRLVAGSGSDQLMLTFKSAPRACEFALAVQEEMLDAAWPGELVLAADLSAQRDNGTVVWRGLRCRIGIHSGMVYTDGARHRPPVVAGPTVTNAWRVQRAACGGSVCVTAGVLAELSADVLGQLGDPVVLPLASERLCGGAGAAELSALVPRRLRARCSAIAAHAAASGASPPAVPGGARMASVDPPASLTLLPTLTHHAVTVAHLTMACRGSASQQAATDAAGWVARCWATIAAVARRCGGVAQPTPYGDWAVFWNLDGGAADSLGLAARFCDELHAGCPEHHAWTLHVGVAAGPVLCGWTQGGRRRPFCIGPSCDDAKDLAEVAKHECCYCLFLGIEEPVQSAVADEREIAALKAVCDRVQSGSGAARQPSESSPADAAQQQQKPSAVRWRRSRLDAVRYVPGLHAGPLRSRWYVAAVERNLHSCRRRVSVLSKQVVRLGEKPCVDGDESTEDGVPVSEAGLTALRCRLRAVGQSATPLDDWCLPHDSITAQGPPRAVVPSLQLSSRAASEAGVSPR
eukprot:TRINITY_DN10968_c0_g1_i2.p1 TRINITY_DN10968_c0_g1~~TRINITY_DN10968_c0_g1_i2.p1  ORF type:complete len:1596 (+),score=372.35 TRINITY_DN10968_c0_g1_i2:57-4790(+)